MKKLKKSIKAIIISLCLVVVLAGSAVGVILSRDKNGSGNPDNGGSSKPTYQLSDDQKSLFDNINKNLNSEIKVADVFDRDSYVDENGDEIDMSLVLEDAGEYLEIKDDIGTSVMIQQKKDVEIYYVDAFSLFGITENVLYRQYFECENGYIAYIYAYEHESAINVSLSVYDISNVSEIKKANEVIYENVGSNFINHFSFEYSDINIENGLCYVQYPQENVGEISFKFDVFPLTNFENVKTYDVSQDDYDFVQMSKNSYVFVCEDIYYFGYLKNDNIVEYSFELENVSNLYLCEDKVFVETETTLESDTYSYYVIDLTTGIQKQFEIDTDYARAVFDYSSTNYYEMYEYKVDGNGNQTTGRFVYLDKNLNRVVVYDANSISDKVVYSKGTNILTNSGVLTFKNSINAEYIIKFDESNNLMYMSSYGVNADTFIVFDEEKSIFRIMNIDGEFVFDDDFYSIVSYENGYYFARTQSTNYVLNVKNKTMSKVSNYASNNSLIYVGAGYYFTSYIVGDDTLFKMFDYSGKFIYEDIKSLNYYLENKFTLLDIAFENETITYNVTGFVNLVGQNPVVDSSDREISLYGDSSTTSSSCTVSFDGCRGDDESGFKVTITMPSYYVLNSSGSEIELDRNNAPSNDITIKPYTSFDIDNEIMSYGYSYTNCDSADDMTITYDSSNSRYYYTITGDGKGNNNVDNMLSASISKQKLKYILDVTVEGTTTRYNANTQDSITVPTPSKFGYTFSGWSGNASGTSCTITKSPTSWTKYSITANFTANKYTIQYNYNGGKKGTYAPTSLSYGPAGGAYDASISNPTKVGYTFNGWNIGGMSTNCTHYWGGSAQGSDERAWNVMADTGFLNLRSSSGDVWFAAQWRVTSYTIEYDPVGGTLGTNAPTSKNYNAEFSVSHPTKLGYTFTGWNISGMSTNCTHTWGGSNQGSSSTASKVTATTGFCYLNSASGTVKFTATWQANTYSITYVLGNGKQATNGTYPTTLSYDSTYNISAPVCMGYTFAGWTISGMSTDCTHYWGGSSRGKNATASTVTATTGFKNLCSTSGVVTFTANWTARSYTITYDMNNPNATTSDISNYSNTTSYYDTLDYISHPSKVGYIFAGWTVSGMDNTNFETSETVTHYSGASSATLVSFTGTDIGTPTLVNYYKNLHSGSGTVTFTANWTPITYNLTYDANGGAFDSDVNNTPTATFDAEFNVISPRKHGYDFIGWEITNTVGTTERECLVAYPSRGTESFINLTTVNNSTVTLKAKWHETYYNIYLSYNNPTIADETVIAWYDVEVTIENPVRMGYIFDYWTITGCSDCSESGRPDLVDTHYYGETSANTAITGSNLAGQFTCTKFKNLHCICGSTVTFTAHWIQKTYKVMNHAAGYYNPVIATEYTVKFDEVFSFAVPENSPFGYHFGGWRIENCNETDEDTDEIVTHYHGGDLNLDMFFTGTTDSVDLDGNEITYYFMNLSSNQDAVVNIYPIWNPNEYYITFDMNNPNVITTDISTFADVTAYYDNYYDFLWIDYPTKAGYTFLGWSISNMTDDCTHYYDIDETWVANEPFESANGKYTDPNNPNKYIFMKNHAFKNLRSDHLSSTKVVFTANWQAIKYTITYHFLPTNFDVTAYLISELNTKVNKVSQMTVTQTVTVTYDKLYEALNYRYEIDSIIFIDTPEDERKINYDLPIGMKLKAWGISASTKTSSTITGKSDGAGSVMSAFSDYILPNEQRMYGPGTEGDVDDIDWEYYSSNIHLYACYDLAGITLKYYAPTRAEYKNKMGSVGETYADLYYKCVDALTTTIKYTESVTFANNPGINSDLVGWMISADYFSSGDLTIESLTTYLYNGTTYYTAYAGSTALWNFTNVDAYSYDDPTYFLYAVYSEPHSGSFDILEFTYHEDTNSFGVSAAVNSIEDGRSLKIPSYYYHGELQKFLPVTHVENSGFEGFDFGGASIVLPDTITHIGEKAFFYNILYSSYFAGISLSKNLEFIGKLAFAGAIRGDNLSSVSINFPESLKIIDEGAFQSCPKLEYITFAEGLETIGGSVFLYSGLTGNITLPSTLTSIGTMAFAETNIYSINIPVGITRLENMTFSNSEYLTDIIFDCENVSGTQEDDDSSLTHIGSNCFSGLYYLQSIKIPHTVTYIGPGAFSGCSYMSNIELPEKLTYLGASAFENCSMLESIKIPVGVTTINRSVFSHCAALSSIELHDKIFMIDYYAFQYCSSLTEIEIPKSVIYIEVGVFSGCSALERLVVPFLGEERDDLSYNCLGYLFGSHDYYDTGYVPSSLKYVEVTDATIIGEGAFYDCSSIEEIVISDTVQTIEGLVFMNCQSLKELTVPFVGNNRDCTTGSELLDWFAPMIAPGGGAHALTSIKVTSATKIGNYAFFNYYEDPEYVDPWLAFDNLTSIEINEGVTSIGTQAFYNTRITSFKFPKSLRSIGSAAFQASDLTGDLGLNDGLTTINDRAFSLCYDLTKVVIPSTVNIIYDYAFYSCQNVSDLQIKMKNTVALGSNIFNLCNALIDVELPQSFTYVPSSMFQDCYNLREIILFEGITEIGQYAFYGTERLEKVQFPSTVEYIQQYAFSYSGLRSLNCPKSLYFIGRSAFEYCYYLNKITFNEGLEEIGKLAFSYGFYGNRLEFPRSLYSLGDSSFGGYPSVETIIFNKPPTTMYDYWIDPSYLEYVYVGSSYDYDDMGDSLDSWFSVLDYGWGICPDVIFNYDHMVFTYHAETDTYSIGGTTKYGVIGDYCYNNGNFTIPSTYDDGVHGRKNVTKIDDHAFEGHWISSLYMPTTITHIGDYAFCNENSLVGNFSNYVYSLPTITLHEGITYIGDSAFSGCLYLTITPNSAGYSLPTTLTELGPYAFYDTHFGFYDPGRDWNNDITSIMIPAGLTRINDYTFSGCVFPKIEFASNTNIKVIGRGAFSYCSSLTEINLPDSVEVIEDNAFNSAPLATFEFHEGIKSIGYGAFASTAIKTVSLPRSLDVLQNRVFANCQKLSNVFIPASVDVINAPTYDYGPFYLCNYTKLMIFCEDNGRQSGWGSYWNNVDSSTKAKTFYGYPMAPNVIVDSYVDSENYAHHFYQTEENLIETNISASQSSHQNLFVFKATSFVNIRFEYALLSQYPDKDYNTGSYFGIYVNPNGQSNSEPVARITGSVSWQYYSRMLGPGDVLILAHGVTASRWNSNSWKTEKAYIKNLRFDPVTSWGMGHASYGDFNSGDHSYTKYMIHSGPIRGQHNTTAWLEYHAIDYVNVSFKFRSYGENCYDYIIIYLNGEFYTACDDDFYLPSNVHHTFSENLKPGDVLRITYKKDVSDNEYEDAGYFYNFFVSKPRTTNQDNALGQFRQVDAWTNVIVYSTEGTEMLRKTLIANKANTTITMQIKTNTELTPLWANNTIYRTGVWFLVAPATGAGTLTSTFDLNDANHRAVLVEYEQIPSLAAKQVASVTLTIPNPGTYFLYMYMASLKDFIQYNFDVMCTFNDGASSPEDATFTHWLTPQYDPGTLDFWNDTGTYNFHTTAAVFGEYRNLNYYHGKNDTESGSIGFSGSIGGNNGISDIITSQNSDKDGTGYWDATSTWYHVIAPYDGVLSFDYNVSSERSWDLFVIFVNGELYGRHSGTSDSTYSKASGHYEIAVERNDIVEFRYQKDSSDYDGRDSVSIYNIEFKKEFIFKREYDSDQNKNFYTSTNNGVQDSESVYFIRPELCDYDQNVSTRKKFLAAYINIDFAISAESINDRFEVWTSSGERLYRSYNTATGRFEYYCNTFGEYLIVKYVKDGSLDVGDDECVFSYDICYDYSNNFGSVIELDVNHLGTKYGSVGFQYKAQNDESIKFNHYEITGNYGDARVYLNGKLIVRADGLFSSSSSNAYFTYDFVLSVGDVVSFVYQKTTTSTTSSTFAFWMTRNNYTSAFVRETDYVLKAPDTTDLQAHGSIHVPSALHPSLYHTPAYVKTRVTIAVELLDYGAYYNTLNLVSKSSMLMGASGCSYSGYVGEFGTRSFTLSTGSYPYEYISLEYIRDEMTGSNIKVYIMYEFLYNGNVVGVLGSADIPEDQPPVEPPAPPQKDNQFIEFNDNVWYSPENSTEGLITGTIITPEHRSSETTSDVQIDVYITIELLDESSGDSTIDIYNRFTGDTYTWDRNLSFEGGRITVCIELCGNPASAYPHPSGQEIVVALYKNNCAKVPRVRVIHSFEMRYDDSPWGSTGSIIQDSEYSKVTTVNTQETELIGGITLPEHPLIGNGSEGQSIKVNVSIDVLDSDASGNRIKFESMVFGSLDWIDINDFGTTRTIEFNDVYMYGSGELYLDFRYYQYTSTRTPGIRIRYSFDFYNYDQYISSLPVSESEFIVEWSNENTGSLLAPVTNSNLITGTIETPMHPYLGESYYEIDHMYTTMILDIQFLDYDAIGNVLYIRDNFGYENEEITYSGRYTTTWYWSYDDYSEYDILLQYVQNNKSESNGIRITYEFKHGYQGGYLPEGYTNKFIQYNDNVLIAPKCQGYDFSATIPLPYNPGYENDLIDQENRSLITKVHFYVYILRDSAYGNFIEFGTDDNYLNDYYLYDTMNVFTFDIDYRETINENIYIYYYRNNNSSEEGVDVKIAYSFEFYYDNSFVSADPSSDLIDMGDNTFITPIVNDYIDMFANIKSPVHPLAENSSYDVDKMQTKMYMTVTPFCDYYDIAPIWVGNSRESLRYVDDIYPDSFGTQSFFLDSIDETVIVDYGNYSYYGEGGPPFMLTYYFEFYYDGELVDPDNPPQPSSNDQFIKYNNNVWIAPVTDSNYIYGRIDGYSHPNQGDGDAQTLVYITVEVLDDSDYYERIEFDNNEGDIVDFYIGDRGKLSTFTMWITNDNNEAIDISYSNSIKTANQPIKIMCSYEYYYYGAMIGCSSDFIADSDYSLVSRGHFNNDNWDDLMYHLEIPESSNRNAQTKVYMKIQAIDADAMGNYIEFYAYDDSISYFEQSVVGTGDYLSFDWTFDFGDIPSFNIYYARNTAAPNPGIRISWYYEYIVGGSVIGSGGDPLIALELTGNSNQFQVEYTTDYGAVIVSPATDADTISYQYQVSNPCVTMPGYTTNTTRIYISIECFGFSAFSNQLLIAYDGDQVYTGAVENITYNYTGSDWWYFDFDGSSYPTATIYISYYQYYKEGEDTRIRITYNYAIWIDGEYHSGFNPGGGTDVFTDISSSVDSVTTLVSDCSSATIITGYINVPDHPYINYDPYGDLYDRVDMEVLIHFDSDGNNPSGGTLNIYGSDGFLLLTMNSDSIGDYITLDYEHYSDESLQIEFICSSPGEYISFNYYFDFHYQGSFIETHNGYGTYSPN